MVDAAGAIYVLGGGGVAGVYNDVWASTDGGARAGLSRGGGYAGKLGGYYMGTRGYSGGTKVRGTWGILQGTKLGYLGGT